MRTVWNDLHFHTFPEDIASYYLAWAWVNNHSLKKKKNDRELQFNVLDFKGIVDHFHPWLIDLTSFFWQSLATGQYEKPPFNDSQWPFTLSETVLSSCETFERETVVSPVNKKTMKPIFASFTLQTKDERCRLRLFKNVNITMPFRIL